MVQNVKTGFTRKKCGKQAYSQDEESIRERVQEIEKIREFMNVVTLLILPGGSNVVTLFNDIKLSR